MKLKKPTNILNIMFASGYLSVLLLAIVYIAVLIYGQLALVDANNAIKKRNILETRIQQIQLDNYYKKEATK